MKQTKEQLIAEVKSLKEKIEEHRDSEAFMKYLDTMAVFHNYSPRNIMLIAFQNPTATNVAGFTTWKKLGRHVKKGERAIKILCPIVKRKEDEDDTVFGFKLGNVFDISQTEGDDLADWDISTEDFDVSAHLNALKDYSKRIGIELTFATELKAYGIASVGRIQIRSTENEATQFTTLIHELAHQHLHVMVKTDLTTEEKEVEAETVTYVVCKHFGYDTTSSEKYLASWMKRSNVFKHLDRVKEAVGRIIDGMETV